MTGFFVRAIKIIAVLWLIVAGLWTYYRPVHEAKWRMQEAINITNGARTAIGVACRDGNYRPGLRNEDPEIGLLAPDDYEMGPVRSVTVTTPNENTATITILFKVVDGPLIFGFGRRTFIDEGATLIYRGICAENKYKLFLDPASTVSQQFWPKPFKLYPATAQDVTEALAGVSPFIIPDRAPADGRRISVRDLADLREQPGRPECHVGEPGVAQYTMHDPRFVVTDPVTGIKTIANRISLAFIEEARNEDIVDVICRVNGTIVSYRSSLRMYAIQIPDSRDLQLLKSTLARLRGDARVRWAYDINLGVIEPAGSISAQ